MGLMKKFRAIGRDKIFLAKKVPVEGGFFFIDENNFASFYPSEEEFSKYFEQV